ncbi:MAG: hypothetical protein JWQ87_5530 [Candidatus Sulfotelmatobacter sp.]|nr:hypothetical protein [Candidatus Sulfotelmatobacter sp.]
MRKRKLILWDTFYIELHGPCELEKDRTASRHARALLTAFGDAARNAYEITGRNRTS